MKAELIACGTELLLGKVTDTNTAYISKVLSHIGIDVYRRHTVGDNKERLSEVINEAIPRADIILITGGLGPTIDDITIGAIAQTTKRDLIFNKAIYGNVVNYFKKRAFKYPKDAIKQALIPRGAEWVVNKIGTAPGLILKHEKKYIIALPGPPRELVPMLEEEIIPYIKGLSKQSWTIKSRSAKLLGLPEASVNKKAEDLLELKGDATVGIYTSLGEVELRITVKSSSIKKADSTIARLENKIKKRFKDFIYGYDDETLSRAVGNKLLKSKKSLAVAESCTGGYLSHLITNTPGSSRYFTASLVTYSNESKAGLLGVPEKLIKKHGAVSRDVAIVMATNIRGLAKADIGLAITGIAGPGGSSKKKPVGLVYIAISSKNNSTVKEFTFQGTREEVKLQSAQQALNMLRLGLK